MYTRDYFKNHYFHSPASGCPILSYELIEFSNSDVSNDVWIYIDPLEVPIATPRDRSPLDNMKFGFSRSEL